MLIAIGLGLAVVAALVFFNLAVSLMTLGTVVEARRALTQGSHSRIANNHEGRPEGPPLKPDTTSEPRVLEFTADRRLVPLGEPLAPVLPFKPRSDR